MLTLSRWSYLVLIVACVSVAACDNGSVTEPTNPSLNVPFSILEVREGTGTAASRTSTVTVGYTLWLYSVSGSDNKGTQIETNPGVTFNLGGNLIEGFKVGIDGMRPGGRRRVVIPPNLAYGPNGDGSGRIPPNATLLFEIDLLSVQ